MIKWTKAFFFLCDYTMCVYCSQVIKRNKTKTKDDKIETCNPFTCPIKHFFNLVSMRLQEKTIPQKIMKETYAEFSTRTKQSMLRFSSEVMDKIIDSMPKGINMVIAAKGQIIKY